MYVALGADFAVMESWRMHEGDMNSQQDCYGVWVKVDMLDLVYSTL